MRVVINGACYEEVMESSGYGLNASEPEVDRSVRAKLKAARAVRVGFGYRYEVDLSREEAESFAESLEAQAGAKDPAFGDFTYAAQKGLYKAARDIREGLAK